jgi:hypothetical protein
MNARLNRRAFISLLGGTAAWPLAARAQQAGSWLATTFLGSVAAFTAAMAIGPARADDKGVLHTHYDGVTNDLLTAGLLQYRNARGIVLHTVGRTARIAFVAATICEMARSKLTSDWK